MHVLKALEYLVNDVLLMDILKDIGADDRMQVSVHEVEHEVDVAIIFSSDHILQPNDVFVTGKLLQKYDLTEGTLGISCVLESIEVLFKCDDLFCPLVDGLPNDTVRSLTCTHTNTKSQLDFTSPWAYTQLV